jgi:hypothetical protein
MGEGPYRITTSGDTEDNGLGSCEAHYVGVSPQEDRSVPASEVGKNKSSAEEGCIDRFKSHS